MGAAVRHMLGMPQLPSHRSDDLNARRNAAMRGENPGVYGGPIWAEDAESFNIRHGRRERAEHW
jgi:hypothetical protein